MDITVIDFFRSKYVLAHPEIMELIDVKLVEEVKNDRRIMAIQDEDEKTHQEALILWRRLPRQILVEITNQFNLWIRIPQPKPDDNSESDKDVADYPWNEPDTLWFIKKKAVENKNPPNQVYFKKEKEKKRKLTSAIYPSTAEIRLMEHISKKNMRNLSLFDAYKKIFFCVIYNNETLVIWNNIKEKDYGDKCDKSFAVIRHIFANISYMQRKKFIEIFPVVVVNIHNILMGSGIYDEYSGFRDYKNIAAHIVLKGRTFCIKVAKDPNTIRHMLEFDEFHPIWDHYKKTM